MKLAFTGHRPESLPFGENENDPRCVRLKAMLLTEIMDRAKAGYDTFYTGCARGIASSSRRSICLGLSNSAARASRTRCNRSMQARYSSRAVIPAPPFNIRRETAA